MPRTYLSFLGAGPYQTTTYFFPEAVSDTAVTTPYVQEAVLKTHLLPMTSEDRVFIFTTKEAMENNYEHRLERFNQPLLEEQGLKSILQQLRSSGQLLHFEAVDIPNGYTEKEVWEIFQHVFACLRPGDEVYFDITNGFRSLPMLGMVLLNYAKALREVVVKAIYYGNFEAGRAAKDSLIAEKYRSDAPAEVIATLKNSPVQAPILDLKAFSQLQDWTFASQSFLRAGNAALLAQLIQDSQPEIGSQLLAFTDIIQTNRGYELAADFDMEELRQEIILSKFEEMDAQFRPLLDMIETKVKPFQQKGIANGLAAVQWCIDHSLIPQGYTFLQETMVSLVIEQALGFEWITDLIYRRWAGGLLAGNTVDRLEPKPQANRVVFAQKLSKFLTHYPKLIDVYKPLVGKDGLRHDINHAGFKQHAASARELKEGLNSLFQDIHAALLAYRLI